MYKSRLQELCPQKSWSLPDYMSKKDSPDHESHFTASDTLYNNKPNPQWRPYPQDMTIKLSHFPFFFKQFRLVRKKVEMNGAIFGTKKNAIYINHMVY